MWTRRRPHFGGAHFTVSWSHAAIVGSRARQRQLPPDHALFAIDDQLARKDVAVRIARRRRLLARLIIRG